MKSLDEAAVMSLAAAVVRSGSPPPPPLVHSSAHSPRVSVGFGSSSSRALAVVTNRWYREQRRAEQDATRSLTLLKQRKISCILKAESLQRGLGGGLEGEVERELEEVERRMVDLVREREERCRRIMDRRVQQVHTLQELGLLEAVGKEAMARHRPDPDLKAATDHLLPPLTAASYSPASSSSSHTSRRATPPLLGYRLRTGSDPVLNGGSDRLAAEGGSRPDPTSRLEAAKASAGTEEGKTTKGLGSKLSPRLGRRNPLRMLSNAIDFRTRRKQRPKSADFESVDEADGGKGPRSRQSANQTNGVGGGTLRSASVTDILETVTVESGPLGGGGLPPAPRPLEGRNSAPDMLPGLVIESKDGRLKSRSTRLTAAATAKQKLSTRFQPQRKPPHRLVPANSVKRAKTFSLGGGSGGGGGVAHMLVQPAGYKTLPKQASSRSLGSTSSSTSQGSQSTASSRKSSDSSNLSDSGSTTGQAASSTSSSSPTDISPEAMSEIAAFEKFIEKYFQNCENNNNNNNNSRHSSTGSNITRPPKGGKLSSGRGKPKVSAGTSLAEVLELSI